MMTLMSHPDIRVIIMQDVQFEDGRINSLQRSGTGQHGGTSTHHSATASALRQLKRWLISRQTCLHL